MSVAKGIYKKSYGFDVRATANGRETYRSFPLDTPLRTMKNWQEQERATLRRRYGKPSRGTFLADATHYLKLPLGINAKTLAQRETMLAFWCDRVGHKRREAVTVQDIQDGLDALNAKTSTKRHYRAVLVALWEKLDGRQAWCPAKEIAPPAASRRVVRAIPETDLARIIGALPEPLDPMGARILVLTYTGLPPGMLAKLTVDDIDLARNTVKVPPREKGAGVDGRVLPLTTAGAEAFAEWLKAGAAGPFGVNDAYRYFKRLCRKADVQPRRLYDLRHTFLTNCLVSLGGNVKAVQGLALHASPATTEIYTTGAASPLLLDAVKRLDQLSSEGTKH